MSEEYIFLDIKNGLINQLIRRTQNAYDKSIYNKKKPNDQIKCLVCGGSYIRQKIVTHTKTNKHISAEKKICQVMNSLFQND